ncbi:MAG: histone deacetylase [Rhodospirillales bacterium]|nr:histone deacetylase [Rhodospirillales bacterium]
MSEAAEPFACVIVYDPAYDIDLGGLEQQHAFDIHKYRHIHEALGDEVPVMSPTPLTDEQILRVHTEDFLKSLDDPVKVAQYLEAPLLAALPKEVIRDNVLAAFRHASGGTLLAAHEALEHGIGINLGGGYHHAYPDHGEGFCVFADMPIAVRVLQDEGVIERALVIDLDVHQGNGTAECLADDATTFTFSMHQGDIYPVPKATSDLDVELKGGMEDEAYLELLRSLLDDLSEKSQPDIVFFQAGCDVLKGDPLASLAMSQEGIVERDAMVMDACAARGVPVVMTLGGGYSENAWRVQHASIQRTIERYGLAE